MSAASCREDPSAVGSEMERLRPNINRLSHDFGSVSADDRNCAVCGIRDPKQIPEEQKLVGS
jgi:hypothetical protein